MSETPTARDMIELPGPFAFKVIVKSLTFDAVCLGSLISETIQRDHRSKVVTRPSKNGRFHAHTVTIHIEVYEEIEALYTVFQAREEVVMVL